jgi:ABC-type multidrug transport system ATPase subunit
MDEAEYCNRISMMVDGSIAALDTPSNLKKQYAAKTMDEVFYELARGQKEESKMKQFIAFVKKEFYHVFRDRKTLLLLFGMPIVQIVLFGFALTNEIKNSKIVICDYSRIFQHGQLSINWRSAIISKSKRLTSVIMKLKKHLKKANKTCDNFSGQLQLRFKSSE